MRYNLFDFLFYLKEKYFGITLLASNNVTDHCGFLVYGKEHTVLTWTVANLFEYSVCEILVQQKTRTIQSLIIICPLGYTICRCVIVKVDQLWQIVFDNFCYEYAYRN